MNGLEACMWISLENVERSPLPGNAITVFLIHSPYFFFFLARDLFYIEFMVHQRPPLFMWHGHICALISVFSTLHGQLQSFHYSHSPMCLLKSISWGETELVVIETIHLFFCNLLLVSGPLYAEIDGKPDAWLNVSFHRVLKATFCSAKRMFCLPSFHQKNLIHISLLPFLDLLPVLLLKDMGAEPAHSLGGPRA